MKKLLLTLVVALVGVGASAQVKGEKAVGVNLSYGTEISNLGIGVKGQYNFTDAIRGEASFDYFLEKDGMKMWDINVNAHYLFPLADKIKVYPLVGLTYTNWSGNGDSGWYIDDPDIMEDMEDMGYETEGSAEGSGSEGKFGVNLGAGISYDINEKWAVNFEAKYQLISDLNQAVFGVGVAYKF